MYEIEQNNRCNDVFQYYNNSRQWEENENCVDQEEFKYTPKYLITTNCMQKIDGCSSLTINNHLNSTDSKNKDLMNIPNQKTLVNHVQIAPLMPIESKEIYKSMKNVKDTSKVNKSLMTSKDGKQTSPIPELILNSDIYEKSKSKLFDKNNKTLTPNTRRQTDNINNTSVFHK